MSVSQPRNLYDVDPDGVLRLHFHPGQARAWLSRRRHVLVLAGTQGGKTSFGPWWLHREIYGGYNWPGRGGGDYLAVTSNFDLFKLKMLPELRMIFEEVLGLGRYWAGDRVIELRNPNNGQFSAGNHIKGWGRIILRSAVAASGLESATAKAAWLDEVGQDEWDVTSWEAILRRLSLYQGRSLGTTTVYNSGWLKHEFYDRWMSNDPDYDVVQFPSFVNPSFPRQEFESAKKRLPTWRFKMFYLGEFSKPAGLVYEDFTDDMVIEPVEIKPHWPIVVGLDFGGVHNASVYIAENTDKSPSEFYAYAEYIDGHMPISDIVKLTQERIGPREYKVKVGSQEKSMLRRVTIIGGAGSEDVWRQEWAKNGLYVHRPPVGDVEVGILSVIEVIKAGRFYVFRSCPGLRHEFNTYRRLTAADGTVSDTIVDKATFHRLDAVRYAFVTGTKPQLF
ncbi:MAG TPA: hypothetical protein PKC99_05970 [Anaerolineales bacterium]|nr:hypothetical protein [Anaerolineales bacterium]